MVDFNINLAKSMTSTPAERARFYNRMLIYLVTCAAMLVGVAFLASRNIVQTVSAHKERVRLVDDMASASEYGKEFFKNPAQAYVEFNNYATDLETLRTALEQRSQFLPVLSQLFGDFPSNILLQSLEAKASDKSIEFKLVAPLIDENGNNVLGDLQKKWQDNEQLRARANAVTQITKEQEMVDQILMAYAKYKCILK